jgi:hypothetical protein
MTKIDDLISNILNKRLMNRLDTLEKRFKTEASDLIFLESNIHNLKSNLLFIFLENLKDCEVLSETNFNPKEFKEDYSMNRTLTEPNFTKSSAKDTKEKTLNRDKSFGKNLLGKPEEKPLLREKSGKNLSIKQLEDKAPTLTKNKTQAKFKPIETKNKIRESITNNTKGKFSFLFLRYF